MKTSKILIAEGILIVLFTATCQAGAPGWLLQAMFKADKIEISNRAAAFVLHNTEDVCYIKGKQIHKTVRFAQKILTANGKNYASIAEYISPNRQIKNFRGWHLSPNGELRILEDDNIRIVSDSQIANYHDEKRLLKASFDNVTKGSVVAFEYEIEESGPGAEFQQFKFQEQQPVKFTQFSLTLPKGWQFHKKENLMDRIEFHKTQDTYTWTAKSLNYQPRERHTPPWERLSKQLDLTIYAPDSVGGEHFADWQAVADWWRNMFEQKANWNRGINTLTKQIAAGLKTPLEKANAIANFVRDEIRYVAIEIGKGRWQPRPAYITLHNRFGDCKDKTVLMQAMLATQSIKSVPVFTNTTAKIYESIPTPFQFNHCIIGIPLKTGEKTDWLFFDPTVPSLPLGELPQVLHGKTALITSNDDSPLIKLPDSEAYEHYRHCIAEAKMKSDGSISAQVKITDYGNRAAETDYQLTIKPLKHQIEFWKSYIAETVPNVVLSDFETGSTSDSAWVKFKMESKHYASIIGDNKIFKPNLFAIDEFVSVGNEKREHPIWLGHARQFSTDITWDLPKGWIFESNRWNINSECKIASVNGVAAMQDSRLKYQANLKYTGKVLPAIEALQLKQFNTSLSEMKNLTILLSKAQSSL